MVLKKQSLRLPPSIALMLCLFLLHFWAGVAKSEEGPLVVRYNEKAFPASYLDGETWRGMDVELIDMLVKNVGMQTKPVVVSFPRALKAAAGGGIHLVPNLSQNDERSRFLEWLGPMRISSVALIVTHDNLDMQIEGYDGLSAAVEQSGLKIAYVSGSSYSASLDRKLGQAGFRQNLFFVSEDSTAFRMLRAGRVLGLFYDAFEARASINTVYPNRLSEFSGLALHPFRVPNSKAGAFIGVSKKLPLELRKQLRAAFDRMVQGGHIEALERKWGGG